MRIAGRGLHGTDTGNRVDLGTPHVGRILYLGYMGLRASIDDIGRADRAAAVLAIVGIVNIPIIKYSVVWWNSLHLGPSLSLFGKSSIDPSMITPLLVMMFAFLIFLGAVLCDALCAEIVRRERNSRWLTELIQ